MLVVGLWGMDYQDCVMDALHFTVNTFPYLFVPLVKTWDVRAAECGLRLRGELHRAKDVASTYRLCPHLRTWFVLKFGGAKGRECGET